jgi:hypothetical protein
MWYGLCSAVPYRKLEEISGNWVNKLLREARDTR